MEEYTEERQEEIRANKIANRKLLRNSRIFAGVFSLVNIILTVAIMLALFIVVAALLGRVLKVSNEVGSYLWPVCSLVIFIGSFILGFKCSKLIAGLVISKAHLEDKLIEDMLERYQKKSKKN